MNQARAFKVFKKADRYDGSSKDSDLAKYLKRLGFCGVWQSRYEHNWAHSSNGFIIRVKKNKRTSLFEYTIGLTLENPIRWKVDGKPDSLIMGRNGNALIFDETNEVCKLALNGSSVFLVPAFYSQPYLKRWYDQDLVHVKCMMSEAHFPLPEGFGRKVEVVQYIKGSRKQVKYFFYVTTDVEKILSRF